MAVALELLADVRWRGKVVAGDRPRELLAALAANGEKSVRAERLIELIWQDGARATGVKGLQVLVSRTRSMCGADAIVRDGIGYRLGVGPAEVDCGRLAALVRDAGAALERDPAAALELARGALALAGGLAGTVDDGAGPRADLRRAASADAAAARVILARSRSRVGAHAEALSDLELASAERPDDESLLVDLLRSEAAVRGPAAALERLEHYRRDLRERLGTNPGERVQHMQRDLLALDRPVRSGVRYDATTLLGRDRDLERLHALLTTSRVVSIVGPGGIGKTRVAQVLARDAEAPVVHVVELVGVSSPEDVVGEVGSALGVRDSVSGRRALTPEQRADLRARIAQRLGQTPGLLVLDNCEHLIEAVAQLVAFLISTTGDLRVLTTSRAPLAIAAERVYLLDQLDLADAVELFRERAVAARPDVHLDDELVSRIVSRLDGLPLAIELAAAKVRAMAVEEIDRRLENRFALLRGGDRSAPDRHQTLLAVIDWSWNLLDDDERQALRRLALFNDGFTLEAAGAVLGDHTVDAVQGLVDQSLLSVRETPFGVRYRMLETVREFGVMQLVDAGEDEDARAARRRWAVAYARRHGDRLAGSDQFAAIDAVAAEEVNLADELRRAISDRDVDAVVQLLAALGMFWAIRGEHPRLIALVSAIGDVVDGWAPPRELEDVTRAAMTILLSNAMMIAGDERTAPIRSLLARIGPGEGSEPGLAGTVKVLLAYDATAPDVFPSRIEELTRDPDGNTSGPAHHWLSLVLENTGDLDGAIDAAERALQLVRDDEGPWHGAILRAHLAQLTMSLGQRAAAVQHARVALPVMQRLGADDDEVQLHSLLALCSIADGRPDDAEAELEQIARVAESDLVFGGFAVRQISRAELSLAQGDSEAGLRLYRDCAHDMRELQFPGIPRTGREPWALFGDATALAAHAYYAETEDEPSGRELFGICRGHFRRLLDGAHPDLDYPVVGLLLFAIGAWGLLRDATPAEDAVRLLALAERFGYNRTIPTMAWERIAPHAEARAPGQLALLEREYHDRRPPDLLEEVRRVTDRLSPQ